MYMYIYLFFLVYLLWSSIRGEGGKERRGGREGGRVRGEGEGGREGERRGKREGGRVRGEGRGREGG